MVRYIDGPTELAREGSVVTDLLVTGVHQQPLLVRRYADLVRPELPDVEADAEPLAAGLRRRVVEEDVAEPSRLKQVLAAASSRLGRLQPEEVVAHARHLVVPLLAGIDQLFISGFMAYE